ncbi:MAG TPA: 4Fe-4S dicluster domain-containing protein [Candidatus Sumerlaeota bacterium]|nr:MAG: acetyl-CoA decarbonylase/synthase complex subunit alpha [candidate division BRC1 bacterium ADurb.Bin183]HOE62765.1 4Fe-4S dicluster domain-containing protein [Candidatus Sumerlaeota bacterium]HRR29707.1 4Fe-4S dicluster domain-containing protein [Candidatus Sumerlaeia bacterium]HON50375.1 4Fe-4S dicluster domain-containing protein [Candidatus Sumerlaeota bacterium]HOR63591.1 4Fe-4S dicluster domain-containing protein [Candidatus Sumerlaeota bacterium]
MSKKQEQVSVFIMGKKFMVPAASTIMSALEYSGFQLKRGVGCREGFCGACATVYRLKDDFKIRTGLACQTVVQEGMLIAQIPFVPAVKPVYDISKLEPTITIFKQLYPETFRCLGCNTCSKACPQDIRVMDYINAVERGDLAKAAELSYDCIRCGMCALRCPAEIGQFNVAILAQRLYGSCLAPKSKEMIERVEQIRKGQFNEEMAAIKATDKAALKKMYYERDIEPGESV